ncbi:gp214 [Bacillus phage W.Ph.]|uniref:Gp214 n=1 Tax=Bacillus phage W.Ph. TaxID=764595 RepID=G9B1W5_9CAUD|nr:gp214 [Bacillus phage W.Ph.]ADH03360.1 gp214 [Bacillus phage W.Ph.]
MKLDELVIADVDFPDESQLVVRMTENYLYILAEDDKNMPREGNPNNFEFFIDKTTAERMYVLLLNVNMGNTLYYNDTFTDMGSSKFYISILSSKGQVLLVDENTYTGVTATANDAIRFREYLRVFINKEEIEVEV